MKKNIVWFFLKGDILKLFLITIIIIIIGKSFHSGSTTITCEFFAESSRDCKSQVFWIVWYNYNEVSEKGENSPSCSQVLPSLYCTPLHKWTPTHRTAMLPSQPRVLHDPLILPSFNTSSQHLGSWVNKHTAKTSM